MLLATNLRKVLSSPPPIFKRVTYCHVSFIMRPPAPSAPREAPTPLVFVSATGWDPKSSAGMKTASSMLAEKGFTCLQVDLSPPSNIEDLPSEKIMAYFESGLKSVIKSAMIPFAPVIISRSAACIIAQTYISSNPATGLFLASPPPSNDAIPQNLLPTRLDEFAFEIKFPIAVLATHEETAVLRKYNRLCKDPSVEIAEEDVLADDIFLARIESWLDRLGV